MERKTMAQLFDEIEALERKQKKALELYERRKQFKEKEEEK